MTRMTNPVRSGSFDFGHFEVTTFPLDDAKAPATRAREQQPFRMTVIGHQTARLPIRTGSRGPQDAPLRLLTELVQLATNHPFVLRSCSLVGRDNWFAAARLFTTTFVAERCPCH